MSFFLFAFKTSFTLFLLFSLLNFDFTIFTFWYSIGTLFSERKIRKFYYWPNWKTAFNTKILTAVNTLCLELISTPHFLHDVWRKIFLMLYFINPFLTNVPLLYLRFFYVFRGYRSGTLVKNGLTNQVL